MRRQRFILLTLFTVVVLWGCTREQEPEGVLEHARDAGALAKGVYRGAEAQEGLRAGPVEEGTGQPVITFAHTDFDFGEVEQGDDVEHIFTFRNTGNADLIIERVRSG